MFKGTQIKRIYRMLINSTRDVIFKGTRIKRIDRMLIKHRKQGTQAKEPTGLIRAIRIIRVLKKTVVCVLKNTRFVVDPLTNGK